MSKRTVKTIVNENRKYRILKSYDGKEINVFAHDRRTGSVMEEITGEPDYEITGVQIDSYPYGGRNGWTLREVAETYAKRYS